MAVVCFLLVCSQGDIRLVGGAANRTGRLEICNANMWGTVCDTSFYLLDAQVACKQLGFSATGIMFALNVRCCHSKLFL